MKLNRMIVAGSKPDKVTIRIQLEGDGKFQSQVIRHRADKMLNEVHEILARHFHVREIKVK
jgi:ribosomal protein L31E